MRKFREHIGATLLTLLWGAGITSPLLVVSGCEVFDQMPQPKNTAEAIGLTITSITSARVAVGEQLAAGRINLDQAEQMQKVLNEARALVDVSTLALNTAPDDAQTYLDMATIVLGKVEEMLRERS